jgi:hypothetical protein
MIQLATICLAFIVYYACISGTITFTLSSGLTYLGIYGLGTLLYVAGYYRAKRKGIPIEKVFKQVPPE